MGRDVAPDDVCPLGLEIPRGHENQVVVPDPHPALYLASNPAGSHLAVGALYNDVVAADQLDYSAQKLAFLRPDMFLELRLVQYFFLAYFGSQLHGQMGLKVYRCLRVATQLNNAIP